MATYTLSAQGVDVLRRAQGNFLYDTGALGIAGSREVIPAVAGKAICVLGVIADSGGTATNLTFSDGTNDLLTYASPFEFESENGVLLTGPGGSLIVTSSAAATVNLSVVYVYVDA